MNYIKFIDKDNNVIRTDEDWNLLLKPREIPKPSPKTNYVDIPGSDGKLDLSEVVGGEIKYSDFTIPFKFTVLDEDLDWDSKVSEITNFIHGKLMKIIISSDPNYYYEGRCEVDKFTSSRVLGNIDINCNVKPYKLKHEKTIVNINISAEKEVDIENDRMTSIPTITCENNIVVSFNGNSYSLGTGSHIIPDIQLKRGVNHFTFEGSGNVSIEYQEGSL